MLARRRKTLIIILIGCGICIAGMKILGSPYLRNGHIKKNPVVRPLPPKCQLSRTHLRPLHPRMNISDLFHSLQSFAELLPKSDDQETLLKMVTHSLDYEWKQNRSNARLFKNVFEDRHSDLCVCDRLMLTRDNTPPGLRIPLVHKITKLQKISKKDRRKLSQNYTIPPPPYKSCSVIGSSGVLLGSRCGRTIDASDFVFRFNMAPTVQYAEDVGRKTNLTTMNPSVYIRLYGNLNGSAYLIPFRQLLRGQSGVVWTPAFGFVKNALGMMKKIKLIAYPINKNLHFVAGDPMHFSAVHAFWQQYGLPNMTSTGFYFLNTAIAMCQKVDVYGFWPFNTTYNGKPIRNHYYNDLDFPKKGHDLPMEFKLILAMHKHGLLRLHIDECDDDDYYEDSR